MRFALIALCGVAVLTICYFASAAATTAVQQNSQDDEMAALMAKATKYTQPSEHHEVLKKFLGRWDLEMRIFSAGQAMPSSKGTSEGSWLMDGRWLKLESSGEMLNMPFEMFVILGYDNFKMSYVATNVQSMDTAMTHYEGDMDPSGKALIMYGTLDEYLTGEHDKMVKYVYRFNSDDEIVLEVHDLPIGEKNTKVVEVKMTRAE